MVEIPAGFLRFVGEPPPPSVIARSPSQTGDVAIRFLSASQDSPSFLPRISPDTKNDRHSHECRSVESGNFLSSRAVSSQVLSAFGVLTSVFGMGTGGTLQLSSPEIVFTFLSFRIFKTAQGFGFRLLPAFPEQSLFSVSAFASTFSRSSPRPISITKLHTLPHFHR